MLFTFVFWFCVTFVAFVQRWCAFLPCDVFEVTGGGGKGIKLSCGANALFLKRKKFKRKKEKISV